MKLFSMITLAVSLSLSGCGGRDVEKVVVRGQVSYQGSPVENGQILFYPTEGTPGPVSGASIKDGQYVADSKGGVPVGKHKVEIRAFDLQQPPENATQVEGERQYQPRRQYLPEQYNRDTDLVLTVPEGSAFDHNFELK